LFTVVGEEKTMEQDMTIGSEVSDEEALKEIEQ
jgi:hypothetical protein